MLDPEGADAHQDEVIARVRELVEKSGGTWRSHDAWGRRRLAYEIAKKPEGVYHLVVFESGAETPQSKTCGFQAVYRKRGSVLKCGVSAPLSADRLPGLYRVDALRSRILSPKHH